MASYLRFEDSDGTTVFLESEKEDLSGFSGVQKVGLRGRLQDGVAVAQDSFERAVGQVLAVHARVFVNAVRGLEVPPDQAEITFGLKASGEAGNFVITKVAGEMNYGVRLVWNAVGTRGDGHTAGPVPDPGAETAPDSAPDPDPALDPGTDSAPAPGTDPGQQRGPGGEAPDTA